MRQQVAYQRAVGCFDSRHRRLESVICMKHELGKGVIADRGMHVQPDDAVVVRAQQARFQTVAQRRFAA